MLCWETRPITACVLSVTHVYVTNANQDVELGRHSTRDDTDDFQLAITDQESTQEASQFQTRADC